MEGNCETGTLSKWSIELDYRPSPDQPQVNLAQDLREVLKGTSRAAFAASGDHAYRVSNLLDRRRLQLLKRDGDRQGSLTPTDILELVSTVNYHRSWDTLDFAAQESLVWQVLGEAVAKLHHKLIYDINKRNYRIAEPLVQAQPGQTGDFISQPSSYPCCKIGPHRGFELLIPSLRMNKSKRNVYDTDALVASKVSLTLVSIQRNL